MDEGGEGPRLGPIEFVILRFEVGFQELDVLVESVDNLLLDRGLSYIDSILESRR